MDSNYTTVGMSADVGACSAEELDEAETFRHPKDKWVVLLGMT